MKCTSCGKRWWIGMRDKIGWVCNPCVKAGNTYFPDTAILRIRTNTDILVNVDFETLCLMAKFSGAENHWYEILRLDHWPFLPLETASFVVEVKPIVKKKVKLSAKQKWSGM